MKRGNASSVSRLARLTTISKYFDAHHILAVKSCTFLTKILYLYPLSMSGFISRIYTEFGRRKSVESSSSSRDRVEAKIITMQLPPSDEAFDSHDIK